MIQSGGSALHDHGPQGITHQFFRAGVGIGAFEGHANFRWGVSQFLQGSLSQGSLAAGLNRQRGGCSGGKVQSSAAQLVLQFQNNPLGNFLAYALGGGEELFGQVGAVVRGGRVLRRMSSFSGV